MAEPNNDEIYIIYKRGNRGTVQKIFKTKIEAVSYIERHINFGEVYFICSPVERHSLSSKKILYQMVHN